VKKPILVFQQMNKFSESSIKRKKPEKKQRKEKRKAFFFINEHTLKVSNHHIYHPKGKIPCHPGTMVREKKERGRGRA
jgi:hypothetical protein